MVSVLPYLTQKFFLDSSRKLNLLLPYQNDFLFLLLLPAINCVEFQMSFFVSICSTLMVNACAILNFKL